MNTADENARRGPWYLFFGLAIGLGLGLLIAWVIAPVTYTDTAPISLQAQFKDQYRLMIARAYQANGDVVKGWVWHSALDRRTCMACVAMHGTFHSLDERLDDHVSGRCAMMPITRSWEELGFPGIPETRPRIEPGTEWFARQTEDVQREMMGPGKYAAWKAGAFDFKDLVGQTRDPRWGTIRHERSLRDILGDEAAEYLDPVRREAALKAATTRAAVGGRGSGKGGRPTVTGAAPSS